ncbi:MAG: 4Fe-4S dicluster domain-containing protein [Planctomycetota bacterium]|jgi:nitrate reductase beta subunit
MARVTNWQIGRQMSYWYRGERPKRQFAAIFDVNKCIACQTCTLACKTTWTSGRGQEYMLWNNVESKPYGFYPMAWDVKILERLGAGRWKGKVYEGRTVFESAGEGERVLGWLPKSEDFAHPNLGEDDCLGSVQKGARFLAPHQVWFFYLARICNHCTYPACLAACPRASIYKRPEDGVVLVDQKTCRGYRECVKACPYKKVFFNAESGISQKCIACFPLVEKGEQPRCFQTCIGKIRNQGYVSTPDRVREDNPIDYLVHVRKVALPLLPQLGLEPNVYYVPPLHTPLEFLRQMFGPGVDAALEAYRGASQDRTLVALLSLFGSTPETIHRFKVSGDQVAGFDEKGREIVRVPVKEPTWVRAARDPKTGVPRLNVT